MKYTDSKNNITFNNVKEAGVYHASGPIGLNGLYTTNGANITDINSNLSLINAIDINWNGALVEPGVVLNTTGDLLKWIKEHSGNGQGTNELTINNQGYWCINGVSTGIKALGENGLTPFIGSNGNWWIGTTDTGVSTNAKTVVENNIYYTSDINENTNGNYRLGTLTIGTNNYPILGKDTNDVIGNLPISYTDSVGTAVTGHYTIGTLNIGGHQIVLNGIDTKGEGSGEGGGGVTPNINVTGTTNVGSVTVTKSGTNESPNFAFAFSGLKGDPGVGTTPNITADASVSNTTGTPSVTVTKSGTNENPKFTFNFTGLKGEQGIPGSGGGGSGSSYDDTQIKTDLRNLENALSILQSTVSAIRNWSEEQINELINQGLNNWEIGEHITPDEIFNLNGWNDKLKEFILLIAFKDSKNNELTISQIIQRLESIEGVVDNIKIVDENGNAITLEQLISRVKVAVEEDINGYLTAVAQLEAAFTKFTTGSSDESEFTLLKSNFAAFLALANDKIAELTAAVDSKATKDYVDQETGKVRTAIGEATAGFYTKSEVDGKISTATAQMISESTMRLYVDGKETELRDAISGLYTKTEVDNKISQATANLVTEATMEDYVTGEINTAKSGLATEAYVNDEITSAKASLLTSAELTDKINGTIQSATSGFVTKTEVYTKELTDGLIASARSDMMSEIDGEYAKITTAVTKTDNGDGTYSIDSNIKLSADLIELDGDTIFSLLESASLSGISPDGKNKIEIDSTHLKFALNGYTGAIDNMVDIRQGYITILYGAPTYGKTIIGPGTIDLYNGSDLDHTVSIESGNGYFENGVSTGSSGDILAGHDLTVDGTLKLGKNGVLMNDVLTQIGKLGALPPYADNIVISWNGSSWDYRSISELSGSDERIKENIVPVETNISDIANARIVNFNFIGENKTKFGSIALDWQNIFPEAVKENSKGNLTMNYGAIALGSAVTAAREIVALKEENQQLKDRLAVIEQKLEAINNALG